MFKRIVHLFNKRFGMKTIMGVALACLSGRPSTIRDAQRDCRGRSRPGLRSLPKRPGTAGDQQPFYCAGREVHALGGQC